MEKYYSDALKLFCYKIEESQDPMVNNQIAFDKSINPLIYSGDAQFRSYESIVKKAEELVIIGIESIAKKLIEQTNSNDLFDERIPSLGIKGRNTPAFLCGAGVKRMATEFKRFPEQYKVNCEFLEQAGDEDLSGVELLKTLYSKGCD